jgi:hypothetical protein
METKTTHAPDPVGIINSGLLRLATRFVDSNGSNSKSYVVEYIISATAKRYQRSHITRRPSSTTK